MRFLTARAQSDADRGEQPPERQRKRERPRPRLTRPRLTRRRLVLGTGALTGAVVLGLLWSGWFGRQVERLEAGLLAASADAGLAVEDVLVLGRKRSDPGRLLAQIGVDRGMPMLAIDPYETKARLETLPWVARATVERRLPQILLLEIKEREPMALWQYQGRKVVIDSEGLEIPEAEPRRFARLPLVVGAGAPAETAGLLSMLAEEPALNTQVRAAVRVGQRRWNLRLANGIDVRLPEENPAGAWAELARMDREHGVLTRDILAIDLRLGDRMILRMAPGAMPKTAARPGGKET